SLLWPRNCRAYALFVASIKTGRPSTDLLSTGASQNHHRSGLVICDSQSALCALSSPKSETLNLINRILRQLSTVSEHSLVHFLWIISRIGILVNDTFGLLAKTACGLPLPAADPSPDSLSLYKQKIRAAAHLPILHHRYTERPLSVTIQHFNHFLAPTYTVVVVSWLGDNMCGRWVGQGMCCIVHRVSCVTHLMLTIFGITAWSAPQ
ncbi:hypothetical protein SK128_024549, partial [Halocaridina rubra]